MDITYIVYIISGLIVGVIILLAVHYVGDYPFPWQIRMSTSRASEPDSLALSQCFNKLADNEKIHIVMGNVSHLVCEQDIVVHSLEKALKKNIAIKLIYGPEVDTRSVRFLNALMKSKQVKLYKYPQFPDIHFRVLIDAKGPKEVFVEEPHLPYEDIGFRRIPSRRVSREYDKIFHKMLRRSVITQAS